MDNRRMPTTYFWMTLSITLVDSAAVHSNPQFLLKVRFDLVYTRATMFNILCFSKILTHFQFTTAVNMKYVYALKLFNPTWTGKKLTFNSEIIFEVFFIKK